MKPCDQIETCRFFLSAMREMPTVAEMMKQRYCQGAFDTCARQLVLRKVGSEQVPINLAPNDTQRAREIIEANE